MKMMRNCAFIIVILFLAGFTSCKKQETVSPKIASKPKPVASVTLPSISRKELKVEREIFDYNPRGRRDPFLSLIVEAKERPRIKIGAPPTESFDVDEIRLVAIAWEQSRFYALITLPDNKSFTVTKGTRLGLYGGTVEDITADYILVREKVKNYKGEFELKDTILKLRQEEEG